MERLLGGGGGLADRGAADPSQSHATGPQHTPQVVLSPPVPHPLAPALVPRYS